MLYIIKQRVSFDQFEGKLKIIFASLEKKVTLCA